MSVVGPAGYREDCCWNDVRDRCIGAQCRCVCHTVTPRVSRREWESIKVADFDRLESENARLRAWLEPLEAWASNVLEIIKERRIPAADVIRDGEAITDMARKALRLSGGVEE